MDLAHVKELEDRYVMPTYGRVPLLLERGKGVYVYSNDGKKYLDFITGIGVNALGHAHPRVMATIREQSKRLIHISNLFYNDYQARLAQRLAALSGMEKSFFTVGGAEAAEGAIKVVRALGQAIAPDKCEIVALSNSFHGRTCGALAITGQPKYRAPFGPLLPGVHFVEANNQAALAAAVSDRTCAIIIEPIQGEGGVFEITPEFMAAAARLAREHQASLIFDEIQCGLGRTGKPFAYQWTDIVPDVVITAKPIACGFPLGVLMARGAAANALGSGSHGTTFGGGPLACRLGLEFLDIIEQESLLENVRTQGAALKEGMRKLASKHACVKEVRGRGLIVAMELDRPAAPVFNHMLEMGVIANVTHETVLRMLPPYIVDGKHVRQALRTLGKALKKI